MISVSDAETSHTPPDAITCTFSGPNSNKFEIDSSNCQISPKTGGIDIDTAGVPSSYPNLIVVATDKAGNSASATVSVTVTDINDNTPVCTQTTVSISKAESYTGVLTTLSCSDKDSGVNAQLACSTPETRVSASYAAPTCTISLSTAIDYDTLGTNPIVFKVFVNDLATTAADRKTTTVTYSLNILSENDNTPSCPSPTLVGTKDESFKGEVFSVTCTDGDTGVDGQMECSADNSQVSSVFAGSKCTTSINSAIDFDTNSPNPIIFKVIVSDKAATISNRKSTTLSYTLSITDLNDNKPSCPTTALAVSKPETYTGTLFTVACTDADATVNAALACTSLDTKFASKVTGSDCITSLDTAINYEGLAPNPIIFKVVVRDNATPDADRKSSTLTYTLTVTDVYDIAPVFTSAPYSCSIVEETTTACAMISVSDAETSNPSPDAITCTLSGANSGAFIIRSPSCQIEPKAGGIDRDATGAVSSYPQLLVVATDKGSNAATATVSVTITDVNDNDPVCTAAAVTDTKTEAYANTLTALTCTDKDMGNNGVLTCATTETQVLVAFAAGTDTCTVKLPSALDYETLGTNPIKFDVVVTDSASPDSAKRSTTVSYTLSITDLNDNPPNCGSPTLTATKAENFVGTVFSASCPDPDSGVNGQIKCSTTEPKVSVTTSGSTCITSINTAIDYDSLTPKYFTFTVLVNDLATVAADRKSVTLSYTISITDNFDVAPVFTSASYICNIDEETTTACTMISVSDAETSHTPADAITCSLTGPNAAYFDIHSPSCNVKPKPGGIDRDDPTKVTSFPNLVVKATDKGGTTATTSLSVTINDLNDNFPDCGTTAITVTKSELFTGQLSSFVCNDKDDPANNGKVICSSSETKVSVSWAAATSTCTVKLASAIDFDTSPNPVKFDILAIDQDTTVANRKTTTISYTLIITDENDNKPDCGTPTVIVSKSELYTGQIFTVDCTDKDSTVNSAMTCSADDSRVASSMTGGTCITSINTPIDYDTIAINPIVFRVRVKDSANPASSQKSTTITYTLSITDSFDIAPVFTSNAYSCSILEETINGCTMVSVSDEETAHTPADAISCTLTGSHASTYFDITSPSCLVKPKTGGIDRDAAAAITSFPSLNVIATDKGMKSATATLSVTILDVNDNAPDCGTTAITLTKPEDYTGTLTALTCQDKDLGINAALNCFTTESRVAVSFSSATSVCTIALTAPIDFDTLAPNPIKFDVIAVDQATPPTTRQTTTISYTLSITDVFDVAPVFTTSNYACSLPESSTTAACTSVSVSDSETAHTPADAITCSLTGTNSNLFDAPSPSCQIKQKTPIDRDAPGAITSYPGLIIKATDKGGNTATATISVTITDTNDNAPNCGSVNIGGSALETYTGHFHSLNCVDIDSGDNSKMSCTTSETRVTANMLGTICLIDIKSAIDYETISPKTVSFTVIVSDSPAVVADAKSSTYSLTISVQNHFDVAPVFTSTSYTCALDEETTASCTSVSVSDAESGYPQPDAITCSLSGVNSYYFDAATPTCQIKPKSPIDRDKAGEVTSFPNLIITATDKGGNTATTTISVTINDKNDNSPTSGFTSTSVSVKETRTGSILTIPFIDKDLGVNSQLDCSSTESKVVVTTSGSSCVVSISTAIDYESIGTNPNPMTFKVQVRDSAANLADRLTSTVTVTMTVLDEFDVVPAFTAASYAISFVEKSIQEYSTITITDSELSHSPPDQITCSLTGTNSHYFMIPSGGCKIRLVAPINRDQTGQTTSFPGLVLTATDKGGNSATASVSVTITDLNDHAPVCTINSNLVIKSEVYMGEIFKFTCTDSDAGVNGDMACSSTQAGVTTAMTTGECTVTLAAAVDYDTLASDTIVFPVIVKDKATTTVMSSTYSFTLSITGVEDNVIVWGTWVPAYTSDTTVIKTIPEKSPVGTSLFTVVATDADKGIGGTITYTINSATTNTAANILSKFSIGSSTGVVEVSKADLDRETYESVVITVAASDGTTTISRGVKIGITDTNDKVPVFTPASGIYTATIDENSPATTTTVTTLVVTDPDATPNTVTCSIVSGNTEDVFQLVTGKIIKLKKQLTIDKPTSLPTSYVLLVDCHDGLLTSTATVSVSVTDNSNDFTPSVNPVSQTILIAEDRPLGEIASFTVSDNDYGLAGTVTCSLTSASTIFSITTCSRLSLISALDYETTQSHTVAIEAKDSFPGSPKSVTTTITVSVSNINDNTPSCTTATHSINVLESESVGTVLYTIPCSDADEPTATGRLSVVSGDPSNRFTISGVADLKLSAGIDYEIQTQYILPIRYTESSSPFRTATMTLTVDVSPVNEATPTCNPATIPLTIPESQSLGSNIGSPIVALDTDKGNDGVITYSLKTLADTFSLSSVGQLKLIKLVDYETMGVSKVLSVKLEAKDNGASPKSSTCTVDITVTDVNEHAPVCSSATFTSSIFENIAVNTALSGGIVTATDADGSAPNNQVRYSIVDGDTTGSFVIDGTTGQVKVKSTTPTGIDFENMQSYSLLVKAQDGAGAGINSVTCTLSITVTDVNEGTPTFGVATKTIDVLESTAINTIVYSQAATDSDTSQTVTYSIAPSTHFSVDSQGKVKLTNAIDYETTTSHILTIKAADNGATPGALTGSYTLTVSVTDVNEAAPSCSVAPAPAPIDENAAVDALIATVTCTDADTTSTLTYFINTVPFKMIGNQLKLATVNVLDYDNGARQYAVPIEIRDQAILPMQTTTITCTINVNPINEFDPVFGLTQTIFSVPESLTAASLITTVAATDADQGSNHATLAYSIFSGNTDSKFSIDSANGKLTLANTIDFDTETKVYPLVVKAVDGGGRSGTVSVTVSVTDVNDITPVGTPNPITQTVLENVAVNDVVKDLTSSITDAESGVNGQVTITISSGNTNDYFKVVGKQIRVNKSPLDAANHPLINLILTLTDGGTPPLSSTLNLKVSVSDVNMYTPTFTVSTKQASIPEDTAVGFKFYTASATDADGVLLSGQLEWELDAASNTGTTFAITTTNGDIRIAAGLDRETTSSYNLIVRVKDKGTPPKSNSMTLTISISDVNDNDPVFPPAPTNQFAVTIAENTGTNYAVTTATATDQDAGVNAENVYSIISQSPMTFFTIDSTTGAITTIANIDRETYSSFVIKVKANNKAPPLRTATADFTITISDVNDNHPAFGVTSPHSVNVEENKPSGTIVATLPATDPDLGAAGTVSYSIQAASASTNLANFNIDGTGKITTTVVFDRETLTQYELFVIATDAGISPKTSTLKLIINVVDKNDNDPIILGEPLVFTIPENRPVNSIVGTVSVSDKDSVSQGGGLVFSLVPVNPIFEFHTASVTHSGDTSTASLIIKSMTGLNYEINKKFNLTMVVTDSTKSATATITVSLTDLDDNTCAFGLSTYSFSVAENTAANVEVGKTIATDADSGAFGTVKYKIGNDLVGSHLEYVAIDESTGSIRTLQTVLDYEKIKKLVFIVICHNPTTGSLGLETSVSVTVSVTDVNDVTPQVTGAYGDLKVNENTAPGSDIKQITATDVESGANGKLTYSIDANKLDGTLAAKYFQITSSGMLKVNPSLSTPLDRESMSKTIFQFFVIVSDSSPTSPLTTSVQIQVSVVDLNDNTPAFQKAFYSLEAAYDVAISYSIGSVTAVDTDSGANGDIGYTWKEFAPNFDLNPSTGLISKKSSATLSPGVSYVYSVVATDKGSAPKSSEATVRIDTFDPKSHAIALTINVDKFDQMLSTILKLLKKSLQNKYANCRVGHMHKVWSNNQGLLGNSRSVRSLLATSNTKSYYYVVSDNSTDSASSIKTSKSFVPISELRSLWKSDDAGNPNTVLLSSEFGNVTVTRVEDYIPIGPSGEITTQTSVADAATIWLTSSTGIAVMATIGVLILIAIILVLYFCCCRSRSRVAESSRYVESNQEPKRPKQGTSGKPVLKSHVIRLPENKITPTG